MEFDSVDSGSCDEDASDTEDAVDADVSGWIELDTAGSCAEASDTEDETETDDSIDVLDEVDMNTGAREDIKEGKASAKTTEERDDDTSGNMAAVKTEKNVHKLLYKLVY